MNARLSRALPFAALALLAAPPVHAQSVLLRLNPEAGLVSRYVLSLETFVDSPMAPASDGPMLTGSMYQTQTVLSVDGDVFEIQTMTDSADLATPGMPMAGQVPDPSGQSQTIKMDSRGRVVELPTASGEAQQMMSQLGQGYGLELPEGEVSPGDSWNADFDIDMPGQMGIQMTMSMDITYTLERVDGNLATLAFTGPMVVTGSGQGMTMDGDGTLAGTMVLDVGRGRIQQSTTEAAFDMNAMGTVVSMRNNVSMALIP